MSSALRRFPRLPVLRQLQASLSALGGQQQRGYAAEPLLDEHDDDEGA
jgi:hypothetical protein